MMNELIAPELLPVGMRINLNVFVDNSSITIFCIAFTNLFQQPLRLTFAPWLGYLIILVFVWGTPCIKKTQSVSTRRYSKRSYVRSGPRQRLVASSFDLMRMQWTHRRRTCTIHVYSLRLIWVHGTSGAGYMLPTTWVAAGSRCYKMIADSKTISSGP